jgi:hypothetical protein
MTRTALYKGVYFASIAAVGALALAALVHFRFSPAAVATVCVAPLIPGRVLGFFWRDLLAGLRLLNRRDYPASKQRSGRFLEEVRRRPWIKHLIWLGSAVLQFGRARHGEGRHGGSGTLLC